MIIHIVKPGESIIKIMDCYQITKEDIINENLHITDFKHLKPGTKLRIPVINSNIIDILEETEPFVEDYYTKVELKEAENNEEIIEKNIDMIDEKETSLGIEEKPKPKVLKKDYSYYRGIRKI